ncbi:hypothetical protein CRG98_035978, partial [Punica granatum]
MAEGDHVDISEEVNLSVPTLSQPPQTHALPPLTPAGLPPSPHTRLNIGLNPLPNRSTIPRRRLHPYLRRRHQSSTIMILLCPKLLNTNPQLLKPLTRRNESRPRKVNRAVQHHRDPADNTRPYQSRLPTSTSKFARRRLYENPAVSDKGKALAIGAEATPEVSPTPPKKVTEEEAEAFMKVIKASEYKVVEQMAKSPAHISLLGLLLNSEPHREALMRVLTAAQ